MQTLIGFGIGMIFTAGTVLMFIDENDCINLRGDGLYCKVEE